MFQKIIINKFKFNLKFMIKAILQFQCQIQILSSLNMKNQSKIIKNYKKDPLMEK